MKQIKLESSKLRNHDSDDGPGSSSAKSVDKFEVARKIVHRWDEASLEVRQAYKQFVGAVVELIDGEAIGEEFKEVAVAVYRLFGAHGEEEEDNRSIISKKSELQKITGHVVSDEKLQKVVKAVQSLSSLQPELDKDKAMSLAESQVNGIDDSEEFGANLVFHQPSRFLVDSSFDDVGMPCPLAVFLSSSWCDPF